MDSTRLHLTKQDPQQLIIGPFLLDKYYLFLLLKTLEHYVFLQANLNRRIFY